MIKKFVSILLISILSFASMKFEVYADGKYNRNLIKGNTRQISMELNESTFEKADEAFLINETNLVDGISVTPLAYIKNAPIIPIKKNELDNKTKNFLKKLGVKKITIVGGSQSILESVEKKLIEEEYEVKRVYGMDRYQTAMKIADEINKIKPVDTIILINSRAGLENALGLYSYAAQYSIPIIWSNDEDFNTSNSYIKKNKIKRVFAIGDLENFTYQVKKNIKNVEIIKEINKEDTNTIIINKLQKGDFKELYAINVEYGNRSKSNEYISLGVVAAKKNIPILICDESLSKPQENFLDKNNVITLDQIGSEINDYSIFNAIMTKEFLSSVILILLLLIMSIRAFIKKS